MKIGVYASEQARELAARLRELSAWPRQGQARDLLLGLGLVVVTGAVLWYLSSPGDMVVPIRGAASQTAQPVPPLVVRIEATPASLDLQAPLRARAVVASPEVPTAPAAPVQNDAAAAEDETAPVWGRLVETEQGLVLYPVSLEGETAAFQVKPGSTWFAILRGLNAVGGDWPLSQEAARVAAHVAVGRTSTGEGLLAEEEFSLPLVYPGVGVLTPPVVGREQVVAPPVAQPVPTVQAPGAAVDRRVEDSGARPSVTIGPVEVQFDEPLKVEFPTPEPETVMPAAWDLPWWAAPVQEPSHHADGDDSPCDWCHDGK